MYCVKKTRTTVKDFDFFRAYENYEKTRLRREKNSKKKANIFVKKWNWYFVSTFMLTNDHLKTSYLIFFILYIMTNKINNN